jgi:hypothetical protein
VPPSAIARRAGPIDQKDEIEIAACDESLHGANAAEHATIGPASM